MASSWKPTLVAICLSALVGSTGAGADTLARPAGTPPPWCPSGSDLDGYLEAVRSLPRQTRAPGALDVPPAPVVTPTNGLLIIEDDGVILRRDRVFDLPLESVEFVPSGDGYQVSFITPAYEPLSGSDTALFTDQQSWTAHEVGLTSFAFPFGAQSRTQLWVTPTNLIAFEEPTEPIKVGLCSLGCYFDEGQVLLDRLPRLSPLQHGTFFYGLNAYFREESDRAVVTWQYSDPANLDIQAVLYADGRIRFNYAAVSGILHGAAVVVTGNDSFWNDLRLGGTVQDPEGDVPIPPPDGPGMDIVSATARQVATSELLQIAFTLAAPPPPASAQRIFYRIELRDRASDPEPFGSVFYQWQNGQFYWMTEPATLEGSTMRLNLRLYDLPLTRNDIHLTFTTFRGEAPYEQGDRVELRATFDPADGPLMLDLTSELPATSDREPVYEAFTLPSLQTGEVLEAVSPLFEDVSTIEAFPILQNLWTDIWFFAGGYHAGGNAGVDGIGRGSSEAPRSPSLLHVNNIYVYDAEDWNMTVLSHEFAHRWLYHFAIEEDGQRSNILNPTGSHPAGWVHMPAVQPVYKPQDYSLMGGSYWTDNGNGTFRSPPEELGGPNGLTWHELYLMGLVDPAEVENWWYIRDALPPLPNAYWAPNDTIVIGERVPVTVDQIIAAEGPRYPAYPDSPQFFLTPMVMVVRPGEFTPDEIATVETMCSTWQVRFGEAAAGRGSNRCFFRPPEVEITNPASDVSLFPGETIDFEGLATDGDGDDVELRWDFSRVIPNATGPGPHPATFTSTGTYPITLDGVDETSMIAQPPDTVLVTVECPTTYPTESVENLRLTKESSQIRFTWTDLSGWTGDYVVSIATAPNGPFYPEGSAPSGTPGLLLEIPEGVAYYEVLARNPEGCLGPR
ncbi:MAG: hypothetical protein JSV80_13925 [Acidobacteriota bacterium]|nr:MAG: hypothetical protein JSV80_13925 [Acidobacteriota bacterium]